MNLKRWKIRDHDALFFRYIRQLSVGITTGGVIGLAFTYTSASTYQRAAPIVIGIGLALTGLLQLRTTTTEASKEDQP